MQACQCVAKLIFALQIFNRVEFCFIIRPITFQRAQTLGAFHVKFESRGFKAAHWDVFAEAMTECAIDWEGGMRCREAMHAWRILVVFFIEEMRKGYQQERRSSNLSVLLHNGEDNTSTAND